MEKVKIDKDLDLILERTVDLSAEKIWKAWTTPELIKEWFCPKPWSLTSCELDLRTGGIFATTMKSPEGDEFPGIGIILEVQENQKLIWTDCLEPDYRPSKKPFLTAIILLEKVDTNKTKYTAIARHKDTEARVKHEEMGFLKGWGICLDQLIELMKDK